MPSLSNTITISASPDEVWLALVDFPRWESWNPFLRDITGVALAGERVTVTVNPNYAELFARMAGVEEEHPMSNSVVVNKSSSFRPYITDYRPGKLLRWEHKNLLTGTYRQRFALAATQENQTVFTNTVEMKGLLVNLGWEMAIQPMYDGGMQLMNEGLKHWVESNQRHFDEALYDQRS